MAYGSCDRVGIQDVMQGYEAYGDYPYFALFAGKELKFVYTDQDQDKGRKLLEENLAVLSKNGSNAMFTLRFYNETDKKGAIKHDTPYSGSFNFKVSQPVTMIPQGGVQNNDQFLAFLIAERDQLKQQLAEVQEENEDLKDLLAETEDDPKKADIEGLGFIGLIGKAGNEFPWMQDIIKDGITMLKHNFKKSTGYAPAGAMAGITLDPNKRPDEQVNEAVKHILTFYTKTYGQEQGWKLAAEHLTKLAALTEDEDIYNLAIKKLMAL